jgi:hypothetical protein
MSCDVVVLERQIGPARTTQLTILSYLTLEIPSPVWTF